MKIQIDEDSKSSGKAAAAWGASLIRQAIVERDQATIVVATGSSQFEVLHALVVEKGIDWSKVTGFHLDEYLGLSDQHPASFRRYLRERFVEKVPISQFNYVAGEADAEAECDRLGGLISVAPIDVAFIGIGENGHLAFNDPPADFETEEPYIVVGLDEACRRQQLDEGWFDSLAQVPRRAISMSVRQIMKSRGIVCTVPDERKALAVKNAVEHSVTNQAPATILQQHPNAALFLDPEAAKLLGAS